jgi:hypothetical protein
VYPLRYTEDFFAKFDEVAARISSTGAEDIFETGSRTGLKNSFFARLKRCEARRGKRGEKPEVYPLRYTQGFFREV